MWQEAFMNNVHYLDICLKRMRKTTKSLVRIVGVTA
jgi:hypothetical protein